MEKYKKDKQIGTLRDSLMKVHKFYDQETGNPVVIKRLMTWAEEGSTVEEAGVPSMVLREISLLKLMEHENIAKVCEVNYGDADTVAYLVFEYGDMDLKEFLDDHPEEASNQNLMKKLLLQLVRAVACYHSTGAAHGDLNHKNVVIDIQNESLKLLNIPLDINASYIAPEDLGSTESSMTSDMFAVGCIFAEMHTRKPLFDRKGIKVDDFYTVLGTHELKEVFPTLEVDGLDLLSSLLCLDPSKRITAPDALEHDYFKDTEA